MSDKKWCKAGALCGLFCGCGIIGGVAGWCFAKKIPDSIGIPRDIGVIKEHWLELSLGLAGVGIIGASSYYYFQWCDIKKEDIKKEDIKKEDTEGQEVDTDKSKEADEEKETTGEKNKFEELGIEFKVISEEMEEACLNFMAENFLPDEPIMRSLGIKRNWLIDEIYFRDAIKDRTSLVALDKDGNILGARIGHIVKRNDVPTTWILGRSTSMKDLRQFEVLDSTAALICKILEFDTWSMFGKLHCDAIYQDTALCSARSHRGRGLGTELVRRAEKLAMEKGCYYSYAIATGIYSARVFDKLGYKKVKQLEYKEFKDGQGQLYLNDTREHTHCTTYIKSLE